MTISIIFYVVFDYSFFSSSCFSALSGFTNMASFLLPAITSQLQMRVDLSKIHWHKNNGPRLRNRQSSGTIAQAQFQCVGFELGEFMVYGILLVLSNYLYCFLLFFCFFSLFSGCSSCCCLLEGANLLCLSVYSSV